MLYLKIDLRKINPYVLILFSFFFFHISLWAEDTSGYYSKGNDGFIHLHAQINDLQEDVLKSNIDKGNQSGISLSYRFRIYQGLFPFLNAEYRELQVRRTGFRDRISGDYVLMLNNSEAGVFQDWNLFYRAFSAPLLYVSGIPVPENKTISIKYRQKVIYKNLLPPFSLLYLIPGKYQKQRNWVQIYERKAS